MNVRLSWLAVVGILCLFAAEASGTVTITATSKLLTGPKAGCTAASSQIGDQFQVDIRVVSDSSIAGATFSAGGSVPLNSGQSGLQFDGGETAAIWFNSALNKSGGTVHGAANTQGTSNGLDGSYTSIELPRTLSNDDMSPSGSIQFFSGQSLNPYATGDGSLDFGTIDWGTSPGGTPDVGLVFAGASHARLYFTVVGIGPPLTIGDHPNDGVFPGTGGVGGIESSVFIPFIFGAEVPCPEPSTTLLLGAGVGSLILMARRRRFGCTSADQLGQRPPFAKRQFWTFV